MPLLKYILFAYMLLFTGSFTLRAQPAEWKALYGKWQVEKRIVLDTAFYAASEEGRKEAMEENKECLTGVFTFADSGITVDKEVCDFENCGNSDKAIAIKHVKANSASKYIYDVPGDEIDEDNVVGAAFLKLIGLPTAKVLNFVELECDNEEMEGEDVRVCIISHNGVALYYDDNLLLLKKIDSRRKTQDTR